MPWLLDERWPLLQEILRRSSPETRRAVGVSDRHSAVDFLVRIVADLVVTDSSVGPGEAAEEERAHARARSAIAELLASGVPVLPRNQAAADRAGAQGRGGAGGAIFFPLPLPF